MGWVDGIVALLCLLAAAALPARSGITRAAFAPLLLGCALGAALVEAAARTGSSPTSAAAVGVALWSMAELLWPVRVRASLVAAGAAAGAAAALYAWQSAPMWLAFPLALAVPCAALVLARRGSQQTSRLRDEALVGLTWAGVIGAVWPALAAGWESAVVLNRSTEGSGTDAAPDWVWLFLALATGAGLLRGWWVRR